MKASFVIAGILIAAGLAAGAGVMAFAGKGDIEKFESGLRSANDRIAELAGEVSGLEGQVSELNKQLESNELLTESNSGRINGVSERLSSIEKYRDKVAQLEPQGIAGAGSSSNPDGFAPKGRGVIEELKEEVKKEIKEERRAEEIEAQRKWYEQMNEKEQEKWKKRLEEEFPKLAQKIKLSPTQEFGIREIAENAFNKIMALWDDAMSKHKSEVDWTAFGKEMEKIYKEAEAQVTEMVSEEQAEALGKFFEAP